MSETQPKPREFSIPPTTRHARGETWQTIIKYGLDDDYQMMDQGQLIIGSKERLQQIAAQNRENGKKI